MPWNQAAIDGYHLFIPDYVAGYKQKIDCADLALAALIDYAASKSLAVRLRYPKDGKWEWFTAPRAAKAAVWTEPYFDEGAGNVTMCTYSARRCVLHTGTQGCYAPTGSHQVYCCGPRTGTLGGGLSGRPKCAESFLPRAGG